MSILSQPRFHDEAAAFAYVEAELWPEGPVCPHCGGCERISAIKPNPEKKVRVGLKFCGQCRKQFTVKVGTIFEDSHIPMTKWLQAIYLMTASKKGVSAHQLHRILQITYKSAWFLCHRIREAMREGDLAPFGSGGGIVEIDETFIGNDRSIKPKGEKKGRGYAHKHKLLSLVDRETGKARSMVVDSLKAADIVPILEANIAKEARVMTDEAGQYRNLGDHFAEHGFTRHGAGEYVSMEDRAVHTNTIEGYFSIFKRGMKGVYQHCGKQHLHRYAAEFEFRYNNREKLGCNDGDRARNALKGVTGKRLTYRRFDEQTA
ncbi:MAG TPA: IS1595 family transposase [Novosphingobium sp.]|nr:IS1595 family transposase [Novosphingobium sp.]